MTARYSEWVWAMGIHNIFSVTIDKILMDEKKDSYFLKTPNRKL